MADFGLAGKVVLITGAGRGLGAATARKFAQHGTNLVLVDINPETLKNTAEALRKEFKNIKVIAEVCDISEKKNIDVLVEKLDKELGKSVDVLVNNAAIIISKPYIELTEEDYTKTVNTNLNAIHWLSQAVVRRAIAQKRPLSIVNISSITTNHGFEGAAAYVVAKNGIHGLTRTMAKELGVHNIRVNAVKPGTMVTEMSAAAGETVLAKVIEKTALRRLGEPEEVANFVVFLGSDQASFCTGAFIDVNGGAVL